MPYIPNSSNFFLYQQLLCCLRSQKHVYCVEKETKSQLTENLSTSSVSHGPEEKDSPLCLSSLFSGLFSFHVQMNSPQFLFSLYQKCILNTPPHLEQHNRVSGVFVNPFLVSPPPHQIHTNKLYCPAPLPFQFLGRVKDRDFACCFISLAPSLSAVALKTFILPFVTWGFHKKETNTLQSKHLVQQSVHICTRTQVPEQVF